MSVFERLLEVQDHDLAADRLRHRRLSLPALAELSAREDEVAAVQRALDDLARRGAEVRRREGGLEDELASVEAKIADLERRLYSGSVTNVRELQGMQADVDSLRRRRSTVEDQVLEVMAEREPIDEEVAVLERERDRLDQECVRLRMEVAEAQAAIDSELAAEERARATVAGELPADLTARYEQIRARKDGIGAARLVEGRCSGCHLALPAVELDRLRRQPRDSLVLCDQCGRILVR